MSESSITQERGGAVPSKGIANLGNTCFFNSVLQNLVRTEPLRSCVQHGVDAAAGAVEAEATGGDDDAGTAGGGPLTDELAAFFKTMCATARDGKKKAAQPVRPKELFEELIRQSSRYKGYQQHDAHELLVTLLDLLRMEERKRLKARAESAAASSRASEDTEAGTEAPRVCNKPPTTYVEHLFGGQCRSGITCKRCGQESVILEPFLDLCLPIIEPAPPAVPQSASQPKEEVSKREKKKQLLALSAEKQRLKKEAKKERGKTSGSADAAANQDASGDASGDGAGGGKGRKKFMSNHEKKREMARIRAEKIAAARSKRRGNSSSDDSSSVSSDEDAAHRDTAGTQDRAGSLNQEGSSQAAQDLAQEDEDACGKVTPTNKVTPTSEASLSKQEKAAAKGALKAANLHRRHLLKQQRTGSSGNTGASTAVSSSCAEEEEEEAHEVTETHADGGIRGRVEDGEGEGGVGEDDLDAFLAAKDTEAIEKRGELAQILHHTKLARKQYGAPGGGSLLLGHGQHLGDGQHQVPYDEDNPDDFLAQQDAIARQKRWQASAEMEEITAEMEAGTTREKMRAGQQDEARVAAAAVQARVAEMAARPPLHAHDAKAGTGRADFDAEAAILVRGGGMVEVVQGLGYLHIAGLEEIGEGGGKDCGVGAGGGDNVGEGGHQDSQSGGDDDMKVSKAGSQNIKVRSPRLSGAPLGLVVVEDDACQSRGVAAAVRQGLVEANSVLEGLCQYVKVFVSALCLCLFVSALSLSEALSQPCVFV